jgi:hypothetical protein
LDSRFADSKQTEYDGFLRAIEFRSTTSFGEEVKPSAHGGRFYGMLKIPAEYDSDNSSAILIDISRKGSPSFATRCLCWYLPEFWWINHERG